MNCFFKTAFTFSKFVFLILLPHSVKAEKDAEYCRQVDPMNVAVPFLSLHKDVCALNKDVLSEETFDFPLDCSMKCMQDPFCTGYNFKSKQRERNCQLTHTLHHSFHDCKDDDKGWIFYHPVGPRKTDIPCHKMKNCKNGGKTIINLKDGPGSDPFECECPHGYSGDLCEIGDWKPECINTEEGKNCTANCKKIKNVGEPILHRISGKTYGAWMRDPLGQLGTERIWYMDSFYGDKVLEFESMDRFKAGEVAKTYTLPYKFHGTGNVIYGRYLYYNREGTSYIVQYDLVTERLVNQATPNENIQLLAYEWGGHNGIDLSVDENGLWVLYSRSSLSGRLCATLLDPLTLKSLRTYCGVSSESKQNMGNAFVACGIVYSIDSFRGPTTTINYAYDTNTESGSDPGINFVNKYSYNSMVTYNPHEKVLYAWDSAHQVTYPLEFED